ncbi:hypothetical protein [Sneathiella glossodoripedis]|uniref:hypothetical protein n=1 Tax=Sneathiella glossodoripedis TaxID=418853 RepID=UPI0011DCEE5D|nr:hypothetical protein [Sneathiella glossodoripedis]
MQGFRRILLGICSILLMSSCNTTSQQQHASTTTTNNKNVATNAEKVNHIIKIYDAVVSFPEPSWFEIGGKPVQSRYYRNQSGPSFVFEQIPEKETFEAWTKLYAVSGLKFPTPLVPLDIFVSKSIEAQEMACGKENTKIIRHPAQPGQTTLTIVCKSTPYAPKQLNYGPNVGQIGLYHFAKIGTTMLKVYQEWRGQHFDFDTPSTWPASQSEMNTMLERFKTIKFTPIDS